MDGEHSLVAVRQLVVEGHDDAIGDNGDNDGPFEDRPVDKPSGQASNRAGGGEEKEGGWARVGHALFFLATGIGSSRTPHTGGGSDLGGSGSASWRRPPARAAAALLLRLLHHPGHPGFRFPFSHAFSGPEAGPS